MIVGASDGGVQDRSLEINCEHDGHHRFCYLQDEEWSEEKKSGEWRHRQKNAVEDRSSANKRGNVGASTKTRETLACTRDG